ncbi:Ger(x)C family spore germination protein [Thermaerobacter subterraneus]|uniref:Ger(x)C family spore germination protein n=1 Tax=Thermaerobacter subterraneus TaxID=175696 RepID=UPI0003166272|nr:Ger(x)C family spore germination protein [Thermaerobacter subterraneus]
MARCFQGARRAVAADRRPSRRPGGRLVLVLVAAALVLGGCWDARDVEDRAIVVGVGLDRARGGRIEVSLEVTIPGGTTTRPGISGNQPGQRGGLQGGTKVVLAATGATVHEAIAHLRDAARFDIFLGHVRVVLVGEDLARAGVLQHLEMLVQNPEIRRLIPLAVVRGRAKDFLTTTMAQDATAALYLSQMLDDLTRTGRAPNVDLSRFLTDVSEPGVDPVASVLRQAAGTEAGIDWAGLAVFRDDRLQTIIRPPEAWYLMWAMGSPRRTTLYVPVREPVSGGVVLDIFHVDSRLNLQGPPDSREAVLRLLVEGRVVEHRAGGIDLTDTATMRRIQARTQRDLQQRVQRIVARVRDLGADPFGIGRALRVVEPSLWPQPGSATRQAAERIEARVEVVVRVRRTGLTIR